MLAVVPAFLAFAVIPFGPVVDVPSPTQTTPLQLTDMPVAVLFVLAVASIGIYGIVLGGWSSGSTYSLLGGLRSSAQMISYEVAMGLPWSRCSCTPARCRPREHRRRAGAALVRR